MKNLFKIILMLFLLMGNCAFAVQFKVLVLPTDLYGQNYYSFPEVSEIYAQDVIEKLNSNNKIIATNLYDVRKKFAENPALKNSAIYALNKYRNSDKIDFVALKKLSQAFGCNSILMVSSYVVSNTYTKRNIWEVLEISSAFEAINQYELESKAVLTDNVNDVVMWSGKYKKLLGDNNSRFWAKSSSQAVAQLEKLRAYSKNLVAKSIVEGVTLRFFPKTVNSTINSTVEKVNQNINTNNNNQSTEFHLNPFEFHQHFENDGDKEIESDTIFAF